MTFYLTKSSWVCQSGNTHLILDAAADRYLWLKARQSAYLAEIASRSQVAVPCTGALRFAEALEKEGILTQSACDGKLIAAPSVAPVTGDVIGSWPDHMTDHVSWLQAPRLALALLSCLQWRRTEARKFTNCVGSVRRWRRRYCRGQQPEQTAVLAHVAAFHELAPYFLTTRNACLFRSLVLLRFLAGFGISADWVFGVRISPFDAHCWVSSEGILLNESRDRVAEYQVIAVI